MGIQILTLSLWNNHIIRSTSKMMKIILALSLLVAVATAAGRAGGVSEYSTDLNDPNVKFAMTAINNYYLGKGDNNARTAVKLISATKQVVAGMLYTYTIQVSDGTNTENCAVTVWSRAWLSGPEATQLSGDPQC